MLVVSCKGHPPPTPHSPSPHLREAGSVASHGSVESPQSPQSPLPGQRGWSLVSNYPTILQPPAHGALVQHKAIQLSIRQSENNPLGVGASNAINGGEDNLALIWEMIVFVGVGVIVILL